MGLQGIDLITAALLFCLGDSPGGREVYLIVEWLMFITLTLGLRLFLPPSAILATNTMVGEIASVSACDHANSTAFKSKPFSDTGAGLSIGMPKLGTSPSSVQCLHLFCGQLFRRKEFSSHF